MKRAALSLMLCVGAAPALAYTAQDAATCAAFNFANWDYEVQHFSAEDRSPGWKQQAADFVLVAERLGQDKNTTARIIKAERGALLELINGFVFDDKPTTKRTFEKLSRSCNRIIRKAPEMKAHR